MSTHVTTVHEVGRHLAVTSFPWSGDDLGDRMAASFATVATWLGERAVEVTGPAVGHYERAADGFTVSAGFVVDEVVEGDATVHPLTLPPGDTLRVLHIGPYATLRETYAHLQEYAAGHRLVLDGHVMWEEYLSASDVEPEMVRTRVTWPTTRAELAASVH